MSKCSKCSAEIAEVKCMACGAKPMTCTDGQCSCACGKTQPEDDVWCDTCIAASEKA